MNFYENEMRLMFGENTLLSDMKFVGKTLLGRLDEEKLLKLQFVTTGTYAKYDAIMASVINKNDGVVDKQMFRFSDIIGRYNRGANSSPITPHIWEGNGEPEWYTPISNAQKSEIASTILDYAELYQDHSQALSMQFH